MPTGDFINNNESDRKRTIDQLGEQGSGSSAKKQCKEHPETRPEEVIKLGINDTSPNTSSAFFKTNPPLTTTKDQELSASVSQAKAVSMNFEKLVNDLVH